MFRPLLRLILTLPALAADCPSAAVGYRVLHLDSRVVALWYPTNASPATYAYNPRFSSTLALNAPPATVCGKRVPLVVFSHGDLGCGLQSIAFTEELARRGYVVAAPDHADAFLCHTVRPSSRAPRPPQPDFLKPQDWSDNTFADRRQDIQAVLDRLLADPEFRPVIDAARVGAAGHSLGGYTVVGMAGGWPKWTDPRIRAVLALSPYVMPFQVRNTLTNIRVPIMYQGGTLDGGITPFLIGPKGAFRDAHPPAYFVELNKASHFAWANCGNQRTTASCVANVASAHLINDYGIAFFNRYLKDLPEPLLQQKNPQLARFEFRLPN